MGTQIQDSFEKFLNNDAPKIALTAFIVKQIQSQGVKLSRNEQGRLEKKVAKFLAGNASSITLRTNSRRRKPITINLDANQFEEFIDSFSKSLGDEFPQLIKMTTKQIDKSLQRTARNQIVINNKATASFSRHLSRFWRRPIDFLRLLIILSLEMGETLNEDATKTREKSPRLNALFWLHSRACQISNEIVSLLSAGFADGAMARWRALHEINVVAQLLSKNEDELSLRYLQHINVEILKEAILYKKHHKHLRYPPPDDASERKLRREVARLKRKYGKEFTSDYGWASSTLGLRKPSLADIERLVSLDHLRPFYKVASNATHASIKGSVFRLSSHPTEQTMVAGPSIYGLDDPGQLCAITLVQVTSALLLQQPNIDSIVAVQILELFRERAVTAFSKSAQRTQAQ